MTDRLEIVEQRAGDGLAPAMRHGNASKGLSSMTRQCWLPIYGTASKDSNNKQSQYRRQAIRSSKSYRAFLNGAIKRLVEVGKRRVAPTFDIEPIIGNRRVVAFSDQIGLGQLERRG